MADEWNAQSSGIALNPNQVADTAWQIQGVDTLNADTQVDLVWQQLTSNQLSVVDERGDADLWACADAVDGYERVGDPSGLDLNVDGPPDLVFQNTSTGHASVWLMNGLVRLSGEWLSPTGMGEAGWTLVSPR